MVLDGPSYKVKVMAYQPQPQIEDGGQKKVVITDLDTNGLLILILKELKKINLQLSIITNDDIDNMEVQ